MSPAQSFDPSSGRPSAGAMPRASLARRILGVATVAAIGIGLYMALVASPQVVGLGESIRIGYVHIGAAWTAYLSYAVTAFGAVLFLRRREARWDRLAMASAEWGVVLTTVTLATGMLWGKTAQGWWWRWDDPRLTLTLLMWFLYVGYLILRHYTEGDGRARVSAVLALIGIPAMVLNHFAVVLFRTFHPAPIFVRPGSPAADAPIVTTLLWSLAAYTLLYVWLLWLRVDLEADRDSLAAARLGVHD